MTFSSPLVIDVVFGALGVIRPPVEVRLDELVLTQQASAAHPRLILHLQHEYGCRMINTTVDIRTIISLVKKKKTASFR